MKTRKAKIISMSATLALISYFIHGFLNNFLDTDKLSIPVWGCMAIIAVMDLYGNEMEWDKPQIKAVTEKMHKKEASASFLFQLCQQVGQLSH